MWGPVSAIIDNHCAVEHALGIAGVPFVKVNPRQARRFAEATGKLSKTDRLVAAILARVGSSLELEARPARSEVLFELKEISIPGVSNITAFALLIAMPELGSLEPGQAENLAGLAPIARQSGRWTGRSFIRGGRAHARQALYMPAHVADRSNPDIKTKYARLIETGKPAKVALTAIMRKLVVLANALLKANRLLTAKTD
jgi:transposase